MLVYFNVLLPQSRAVLMSSLYSFNLSLSPIQDIFIRINLAPITFLPKEVKVAKMINQVCLIEVKWDI